MLTKKGFTGGGSTGYNTTAEKYLIKIKMLSSIFNGSYWWGREDGKYGWWISRDQPWYSSTLTDQTPGTVDDYLQTNPDILLLSQIKLQVELMIIYRPTQIFFYSHRSNFRLSTGLSIQEDILMTTFNSAG